MRTVYLTTTLRGTRPEKGKGKGSGPFDHGIGHLDAKIEFILNQRGKDGWELKEIVPLPQSETAIVVMTKKLKKDEQANVLGFEDEPERWEGEHQGYTQAQSESFDGRMEVES